MKQIDETKCKFLFNKHRICEISAFDLRNVESIHSNPRLKTNAELEELLGITNESERNMEEDDNRLLFQK